jgi:hypothetical protein
MLCVFGHPFFGEVAPFLASVHLPKTESARQFRVASAPGLGAARIQGRRYSGTLNDKTWRKGWDSNPR